MPAAVPRVPCAPCPGGAAAKIPGLLQALLAQHSQLLGTVNSQAALLQNVAQQQMAMMQGAAAVFEMAGAPAPWEALGLGIAGPAAEPFPVALHPAWEVPEPWEAQQTTWESEMLR